MGKRRRGEEKEEREEAGKARHDKPSRVTPQFWEGRKPSREARGKRADARVQSLLTVVGTESKRASEAHF